MSVPVCFPTPLPDETLYSLFCRYHVKSCNSSAHATICQLFDKHRSMQTTVLSAFPLKHTWEWVNALHGITIESLIQKNTAMSFYQAFSPRSNLNCFSYASDRFFMAMYNKCCSPSKKLRYCPKCAQAQWETFGVSYWQILPQINGYEICPVHKEPIRETSISHSSVRDKFFPASSVLFDEQYSSEDGLRLTLIKEHQKEFLQIAEDINFLFRSSYPGFSLYEKLRKALLFDLLPIQHGWRHRVFDDPVLYLSSSRPYKEYASLLLNDTVQLLSSFQQLSIVMQISICREMFGSIRNLFDVY